MSDVVDGQRMGTEAINIVATAAAAFGPPGAPLYFLAASIGAMMGEGQDEDVDGPGFDFDSLSVMVKEAIYIQDARNAWAKIKPHCDDYYGWRRYAKDNGIDEAHHDQLKDFLNESLGANSDLREGLNMIYNPDSGRTEVARYGAQIYILGAAVHTGMQTLAARMTAENVRKNHPEYTEAQVAATVARPISQAVDLANRYIEGIQKVKMAAEFQIEKELNAELAADRLVLGSPELVERDRELNELYLGGEDAPQRTLRGLMDIVEGSREFLSASGN